MTSFDGLRVLFVGDLNPYSNSYSRLKAFRALGAQVVAHSHTAIAGDESGQVASSLLFRAAWKLGFHLDREGSNRWMLESAVSHKPDLIWIEKGNMIRADALIRLRATCPNVIIASYTDDDMFNWSNRTWSYTRGLKHYDVVFTTKSFNAAAEELPGLGASKVIMVDKAFDAEHHLPQTLTDQEHEWLATDVGFIGSFERDRAEAMAFLAQSDIPVRVWGNGWEANPLVKDNLVIERRALINAADNALYSKGICATKINLAFLRKANRDLHTDRSIEIPACGGFLLAEYSDEHARLFEEGREAVFFRSRDDLLDKVRYFLEHEDERRAIASAGLKRCLSSGYSHRDRVGFMLEQMFPHGG